MNNELLVMKMREIEEFLSKADKRVMWVREEVEDLELDERYTQNIDKWLDDLEYLVTEANDLAEVVECNLEDREE